VDYKAQEMDFEGLQSIIAHHVSGLDFIAAPTYPTEAERLLPESLTAALSLLRPEYDYLIADLQHDFSEVSLLTLDAADIILLIIAPELSSIRAAAAALDTYNRLGYSPEKVRLVLNNTFPRGGLPRERIEQALNKQVTITLPYTPDLLIQAINLGRPILQEEPGETLSIFLEDFAFYLRLDQHKKVRPERPTLAWKRVYDRFIRARNKRDKNK
jgi:pilus assembly protein CpaE